MNTDVSAILKAILGRSEDRYSESSKGQGSGMNAIAPEKSAIG